MRAQLQCLKRVLVCTLLPAVSVLGQKQDLQSSQAEILKELRAIHALLEKALSGSEVQPRPQPKAIQQSLSFTFPSAIHTIGVATAPVTIVEFSDFQCPFCNQFYVSSFDTVKQKLVETGIVRFVYSHLPLPNHQHALGAAEAAECVGEDLFWPMYTKLSQNPDQLEAKNLTSYASGLTVNTQDFEACVASHKARERVLEDVKLANSLDITGTPSFVVGKSLEYGIKDGILLVGVQSYEALNQSVERVLSDGKNGSGSEKKKKNEH